MRPALQRLLSRPRSLDLLKFLVETPTANAPTRRNRGCIQGQVTGRRAYASLSLGTREVEEYVGEEIYDIHNIPAPPSVRIRKIRTQPTPTKSYGQWNENLWTREQLDFESDLDTQLGEGQRQRLLDQPH
jgi:hypothetical protein